MDTNKEIHGHLFAFITILIWGTTFISTKLLLDVLTPVEILFLRFSIGFLVLLLAYPHRLKVSEIRHELYFAGILLISLQGSNTLHINPLGDILAVLATVVWASYSILTKKIGGFQYNTVQATRRVFFYGLVFMLPALFLFGFKPTLHELLTPTHLFNILFLGVAASALCFVTWNSAVKILGAVKTSVYIYMVPVITVVTSVLVLRERMTAASVIGIVLTLAGLFISERKKLG